MNANNQAGFVQENLSDWTSSIKFKRHGFVKVIMTLYTGTDEDKAQLMYKM